MHRSERKRLQDQQVDRPSKGVGVLSLSTGVLSADDARRQRESDPSRLSGWDAFCSRRSTRSTACRPPSSPPRWRAWPPWRWPRASSRPIAPPASTRWRRSGTSSFDYTFRTTRRRSRPVKSLGFLVYSGRSCATAVAAMRRSAKRRRPTRPLAIASSRCVRTRAPPTHPTAGGPRLRQPDAGGPACANALRRRPRRAGRSSTRRW